MKKRGHLVWSALWLAVLIGLVASARISTVICRVGTVPCPPDVQMRVAAAKHRWLLVTDVQGELNTVLPGQTGYEVLKVERRWPGTVVLQLVTEPIVYGVRDQAAGLVWYVSQDGQAYSTAAETATGVVLIDLVGSTGEWPVANHQLDAKLHAWFLAIAQGLTTHQVTITKAQLVEAHRMELSLSSGKVAILDDSDPSVQLARLNLLVQADQAQQLPDNTQYYDVRYTLPVVKLR